MPLAEIIAAVTARLAAVPSTRNVYSYVREARETKQFVELFKVAEVPTIHAWMVTREGTASRDEDTGTYRDTHTIALMGYYAVNDLKNSEGTFQQVIEDIRNAFNPLAGRQYSGLVDWSEPVQVDGPTVLQFGNVMCHAAKLTHKVQEVLYA